MQTLMMRLGEFERGNQKGGICQPTREKKNE